MRTLLAVITLVGITSAVCAAAPQYTFAFTVRVDDASPVALNVSVPPGTKHSLQATEHLKLEIEVPATVGDDSTTVVRLVDDSSGKPVVLHTSRRHGSITEERSSGYAVCGGRAKFESPLQSTQLGCTD